MTKEGSKRNIFESQFLTLSTKFEVPTRSPRSVILFRILDIMNSFSIFSVSFYTFIMPSIMELHNKQ